MINRTHIKELENLLDNNKDKTTQELALIIKDFTKNNTITEKETETYEVYQITQDFEDIEEDFITEVHTDDIEETMNEFCQEMGVNFEYDIDTLTCEDGFGDKFKFVKI